MTDGGLAPLFSIITVVKDDPDGFRRTWQSLQIQDFRDWEWFVVDGGSPPKTLALIAEAMPDIARWQSGPDDGPFDGMNRALPWCRGRYLLFLNAGDWLLERTVLATLAAWLQHQPPDRTPDIIVCDSVEQLPGGTMGRKKGRSMSALPLGLPTHHCNMLFRRLALRGLAYETRFRLAADLALTARLHSAGAGARHYPHPLAVFAPGGLSQRSPALGRWEQWHIRRDILHVNLLICGVILAMQWVSWSLRVRVPALYRLLRFQNGNASTSTGVSASTATIRAKV